MKETSENRGDAPDNPRERRALARRGTTAISTAVTPPVLEAPADDDSIDLRQYWEVIVRRRWTIFTFFLIVVSTGIVATFLMTSIFRATVVLQIERDAPKVVSYQNLTPAENPHEKDFYQTQYELLKSRTLAERIINQLGLADHPLYSKKDKKDETQAALAADAPATEAAENAPPPGDAFEGIVTTFEKSLTVEPVRNSRLVRVHFDSPDPALSARVVNTLAKTFIDINLERRMDASSYAKKFLEERLQQMRAKLEDSERKLIEFARQEKIVYLDDNKSAIAQKLQELNAALARANEERIRQESQHQQMMLSEGQGVMLVLQNPVIQSLKQTKAKLEGDYQDGLKVFKPAYPAMVRLKSQIDEMEAKIGEEARRVQVAVKADYEASVAKEKMLEAKLDDTQGELLNLQNRSIQFNILKRDADTNRQLYEGLLQRLKEVGVVGGVEANNVSVVDRAEVPNRRYKPNLALNVLVAMFIGLFGGVGLAFLFEHVDDTIKTPEDAERFLALSVLGVIPIVHEPGGQDDPHIALQAQTDPRSGFAEAYRSVRTALQFSTPEGAPRVLVVTSSATGEGKSTTALSLAIHFAQTGSRVLLIDADLRNPSLHRALNTDNNTGLTNHLAGDVTPAEIARPTFVPHLFFVPTGPLPPNPADLLASAKMLSLLTLATEKFQYVIVDAPPVLGLADAPILTNMADGTLVVVEAGMTRRGFAQNAVKRLRGARAHLLGAIVTKLDDSQRPYAYYQQNYYAYGADAADAGKRRLTASG